MITGNGQSESCTPVPTGPFVREQIRERLRQALCIADDGLGGQLAQFRRLLAAVPSGWRLDQPGPPARLGVVSLPVYLKHHHTETITLCFRNR